MATTFVIACPDCSKQVKVSDEHVGKKIKCKGCGKIYPVQPPGGAKKAGPPPVKTASPPPAPVQPAMKKAYEEDEDDGQKSYGLQATNDTLPRCPFCAKELESHEARVCLNCGYDTVKRLRPEVKQVYGHSAFELFLWWLPGIMSVLTVIGMIVWYLFFWRLIVGWLEDSAFEDEKGPPPTYIAAASPGFFRLYHALLIIFLSVPLVRFAYKRLIVKNKPPEVKIKDDLF